ncbi:HD-GYP domain-containing protein [Streptomyces sp. NPDC059740]|uniref:HD-GYP domain-containing protein n=1 Tax=Streptomyces sp. NPDC059740 TaxID=3346926 RepID=UPI003667FB05
MGRVPKAAGVWVGAVTALGVLCVAPAVTAVLHRPGGGGPTAQPLTTWAVLAACHLAGELLRRHPALRHLAPRGVCTAVLLAGALLLPAPWAALVGPAGASVSRVEADAAALRRVWGAAQLTVATYAASRAARLVTAVTGFRAAGGEGAPPLPGALLPALAAAVVLAAVLGLLHGSVLVLAERRPARGAWRGLLLPALPAHLVHAAVALMAVVVWSGPGGPLAALPVLLPVCVAAAAFGRSHRQDAAHQSTIRALVQAVDIKDRYTRGHSERVGRASLLIGRELGLPEERVEVLRLAGILHDVGKLGVPTRLLRKEGPLTEGERRVIELHPEYGHEIVRGIGFLGAAREAILHHHERLDGRGYPYGLSGDRIPEAARVVAVADAFDAMTSTRSYRRARPVETALRELGDCAGTQFDARMVAALTSAVRREGWHPHSVTLADTDRLDRGHPAPVGGAR